MWTRPALAGLSRLLGDQGVGMEPDPAVGPPKVTDSGRVVLYRRIADEREAGQGDQRDSYPEAAVLLQMLIELARADGGLTGSDVLALPEQVEAAVALTAAEPARLRAHAMLLNEQPRRLSQLLRRLHALSQPAKAIAVRLLTPTTAGAPVRSGTHEVAARLLHALAATSADADGEFRNLLIGVPRGALACHDPLAQVRTAGVPAPEFPLPARPVATSATTTSPVLLDPALIDTVKSDSAVVTARLAEIFRDDDDPPGGPLPGECARDPDLRHPVTAAGLDLPHSRLLLDLAEQRSWTGAELARLCAQHALLPAGALDTLNEAALDLTGEPVCAGTDPIRINTDILRELL